MDTSSLPESKKGINPKIFLIGLPLFIVQLVVVYFVTANILLSKVQPKAPANAGHEAAEAVQEEESSEESAEAGTMAERIFTIENIIVNPAGTQGRSLMQTSIGFELSTKEQAEELKKQDVMLKDVVISVLSSKTVPQLSNVTFKDSLKTEITKSISKKMPKMKVKNIYFSEYIIQ